MWMALPSRTHVDCLVHLVAGVAHDPVKGPLSSTTVVRLLGLQEIDVLE